MSLPGTAGSSRTALATLAASTARSNPMENAVSSATRFASLSVAATTGVVGPRVRNAARTGFVNGRPVPASAPGWTVIV